MIDTNYFSLYYHPFILFKVLGVSSVHWYSWTPNSWREQEDFSVSVLPLKVDQIFATVCCAVFLSRHGCEHLKDSPATFTSKWHYPYTCIYPEYAKIQFVLTVLYVIYMEHLRDCVCHDKNF